MSGKVGVKGLIDDYFQLVAKVQLLSSCGFAGMKRFVSAVGIDGAFKPLEIGTVKEKSSISDPCKSVSEVPTLMYSKFFLKAGHSQAPDSIAITVDSSIPF